tara:strand:+ start:898 stop:1143 length:246 start_codon:yes stop_codon:yes gene_type:complete
MVKTLVIIILLFNGTIVKDHISFNSPIDLMDCLALGDAYREVVSTYSWGEQNGAPDFRYDAMKQGWYLNDGRGTVQGHYCE